VAVLSIVAQSRSGEATKMRCSISLQGCSQASVTCLSEPTYGSIPDVVRPRPAFGCDAVAPIVSATTGGCQLYFARRVTFLSCAENAARGPCPSRSTFCLMKP
jgi:hypothetical protein